MPAEAEHRAKYRENRRLLDGPPPLSVASEPWAATVAFYAALHLVETLAARNGVHHTRHVGHGSRALYVSGHPVHYVLLTPFRSLYQASLLARYESPATSATACPAGVVQAGLIDTHLAAIEAHVAAAIAGPI